MQLVRLPPASIIALDFEGTLVSNGISLFPRPGLRRFLEACGRAYAETVVYSAVDAGHLRRCLRHLEKERLLPPGFARVRLIPRVAGQMTKDLRQVGPLEQVILIDDMDVAVPGQEARVILIPAFEPPYPATDRVLHDLADLISAPLGHDS